MSHDQITRQALACREAAQTMAELSSARKHALLQAMADQLQAHSERILAANARDMAAAAENGITGALLDRLRLDESRLTAIAGAVREVTALPDPVGRVTHQETRPNGLRVRRERVPLGVIAMIYEARPNVTADAAALCLYAGNGVILRGGSEAIHTNTAMVQALQTALREAGLPVEAISMVTDLSRPAMVHLMQLSDVIDLLIPRGGEGLIRFVAENARVPVIKHYKGVCHLYVDAGADLDQALDVLIDGKTSRPGVCNALETLLVHRDVAGDFLPRAITALRERGVEVRGDAGVRAIVGDVIEATLADFEAEYLDLIIAVRVLDGIDAAIEHIRRYGSGHTETIVTAEPENARRFAKALRAAVVIVNASSRFSDGGELGLGAEIGISTTRLHAYGPMGAEALTIERYVVEGEGQVRHPQSRMAR